MNVQLGVWIILIYMMTFGSHGLLNNVKAEQPYMKLFLSSLLSEQNAYTTKSGDTLSAIASKHKVKLKDLLTANPQIEDPNRIGIGDSINIPGAAQDKPQPGPYAGTYDYEDEQGKLQTRDPFKLYPDTQKTKETKPEEQPKRDSPFTSGIKSFAKRAAKLGGEFVDLMPDLEREEGYKRFAYPDPKNPKTGPITVGIGSTRTREAERVLRDKGLDPNRVFTLNPRAQQGVSRDIAREMAGAALAANEPELRAMYPTYDQESASTRNVLRSMAYNMGTGGLYKFKNMNQAITSGDIEAARREALDSKREEQVPERAKREAEMMMPRPRKDERTGRWYSPLPPE